MPTANDRLWAPWRSGYITNTRKGRSICVFCRARRSRDDRAVQVLARGRRVFCLLNRYPYNVGHAMVAVSRHVGELSELTAGEQSELMQMAERMVTVMRRALRPHGFNLGINLGRTAGAGIPGHLHLHIVPRWNGDTNFMPVVGGTKVLSQSLEELYATLKPLMSGTRG